MDYLPLPYLDSVPPRYRDMFISGRQQLVTKGRAINNLLNHNAHFLLRKNKILSMGVFTLDC